MKTFLILTAITLSSTAFAIEATKSKCANEAVYAAVAKNYKTFDVGTSSCGIKALNIAEHLETYVVCTSDETDPMEYIVTVIPNKADKTGQTSKKCVVDYVSSSSEGETPSFESDAGLIKDAQECSVDYGDAQIVCK